MKKTNCETRATLGSENLALASHEIRFPCFGAKLFKALWHRGKDARGQKAGRGQLGWHPGSLRCFALLLLLLPILMALLKQGNGLDVAQLGTKGGTETWASTLPRASAATAAGRWSHRSWVTPFLIPLHGDRARAALLCSDSHLQEVSAVPTHPASF